MATGSFTKHATYKNRSYLPIDYVDNSGEYTAGILQGQRFSIYYPTGSPSDYPVNKTHPNRWAWMMFTVNTTFILSQRDFADATAFAIDTTTATTGGVDAAGTLGNTCVTAGVLWQCLMNGIAVVCIQNTATASSGNTDGTTPRGNGCFHLPGGASGFYESPDFPSARKDTILAIQHIMELADTYSLCRDAWGCIGTSGGVDTLAWCALAPSRAYELGSYGRYQWSTVPNVLVASNALLIHTGIMATTIAGLMFPTTETGSTIATTLAGVPSRYLRESGADHYISDFGEDCIPPTYYHGDVAALNGKFGMPFERCAFGYHLKSDGSGVGAGITITITTGTTYLANQTLTLTASAATFIAGDAAAGKVWRVVGSDGAALELLVTADSSTTVCSATSILNVPVSLQNVAATEWYRVTRETNTHTIWHGLALRGMMNASGAGASGGRVFLATGTSGATTTDGNSVAAYVDRYNMTTPQSIDADGEAGLVLTDDENKPINFILRNINKPRWDLALPRRGIARRGQINSTGRFCVPPRENRAGIFLECTSRPELDEVALYCGSSLASCTRRLMPGERAPLAGHGPLWLRAAGDMSKVARYAAREVAEL
mgnify:CR=1 FL=1